MARILYGVMGNTHGHVMRSQAIASRLPEHEFYFIGGGRAAENIKAYPVFPVPVLRTIHKRQRVAIRSSIHQIALRVMDLPPVLKSIRHLMEEWQPDIAICDREFFLPLAAKQTGLKCFSLNHSHILQACSYPVPASEYLWWSLAMLEDKIFFNYTDHNLIVSFYHPPLKKGSADELFPPVLRQQVGEIKPSSKDHILVYQTSPTFPELIATLKNLSRPVIVYGFRNELSTEGNITFKPYHTDSILEDLASCAYTIVNGGHNLIAEALYYGKPAFCFPIAKHFEQFMNAWHVRELGYGDFSTSRHPTSEMFQSFENNLEEYKAKIRLGSFNGTDQVVQRIRQIVNPTSRTSTNG